ncbi:MAG: hypothetical protein OI74_02375 [Gammaproteobacteria bacterium (ex Lamellibrachia satsuma)]|nr:MAG: hypothetical protein OI74_02375 [Gammaproteobacteria bacterium (ex Lamellibrachia satsuma)]
MIHVANLERKIGTTSHDAGEYPKHSYFITAWSNRLSVHYVSIHDYGRSDKSMALKRLSNC